jgi:ATP-dependent RNA helicase DHX29
VKPYVAPAQMSMPDTPIDSPLPSGTTTPRIESDTRHIGTATLNGTVSQADMQRPPTKKVAVVDYDSDIDPDDLLPVYLECKTKLFQVQQAQSQKPVLGVGSRKPNAIPRALPSMTDPESAKLLRKIKRIEDDILFDQYVADQQWEVKRIHLERDAAAHRNAIERFKDDDHTHQSEGVVDSDDEVSKEAAKMGAALLEENDSSDDDAALADLFASLPVNEVDPLTGKTSTVINGSNGIKVTIRDFGKWTGMSPTRVLEEACRAR